MSRWLRINEDCIDNPKILKLPEALRWQWVALLCVASKNDGVLPPIDDVALCLRVPEAKAAEFITKLVKARLIDQVGDHFVPHNWTKRQFKSDSSTERVKKHRDKHRNVSPTVTGNVSGSVSETVSETAPEQSRAETESEQSRADTRELDEIGLKQEGLLKAAFIAECVNRPKVPDTSIIRTWLLDGIPMGTISRMVPPILRKKLDMKSLSYCDAAVREEHAKGQFTPSLEPVPLSDADWRSTVKRFKANRSQWSRHAGPEPGMTGCRCPVQVLVDAQIDPATGYDMTSAWHFIDHTTNEMAAFIHDAQTRRVRPPVILKFEQDGVERCGFFSQIAIPPGYDEATGERIAPAEENAA
ncbi:hypothetical protein JQ600_35600 [Bradyrhizobium sp. AUGA SZCCT0176]|uniref:hypothetical protein n=1 Tax=Bradyrhizobium sp. AUGA SZCCT0176 TaxID=2807664 RepID=UPI001BA83279|nr:hypothetical protein [Bradyrhizobium sp. AUGA SZCCT0176]MBR1230223.1 hypothetical protein [Bradyrhizobium sp. AUGA SZCCT0176]